MKVSIIVVAPLLLFGCLPHRDGPATWHDVMYDCVVMQERDWSCGLASLATLMRCEFGDREASEKTLEEKLREIVADPEQRKIYESKGVTIRHLRDIAIKRNYQARVRQLQIDDLTQLDRPIIVYLTIDGEYGHFVVLREVTSDGWVRLSDPSRGMVWLSVGSFVREWKDPKEACAVDEQLGYCVLYIRRAGYEPYQEIFRKTDYNWRVLQRDAVRSLLFR